MNNIDDTVLHQICKYILEKGERTYQIEEVSRGLSIKRDHVTYVFSILSDKKMGNITKKGHFFPNFIHKFWKMNLFDSDFIIKWIKNASIDNLIEITLNDMDKNLIPFIKEDIEQYYANLQNPTDVYKVLTKQKEELDSKIRTLENELDNLSKKQTQINVKLQEQELLISQVFKDILMKQSEIMDKAKELFELKKKKELWCDIFTRLNIDIPILLPRLSELLNTSPKICEDILKTYVAKDPSRGKYLELEQVFIKGQNLENSLNELMELISH